MTEEGEREPKPPLAFPLCRVVPEDLRSSKAGDAFAPPAGDTTEAHRSLRTGVVRRHAEVR